MNAIIPKDVPPWAVKALPSPLGLGLFAGRAFRRGEVVMGFSGPLLRHAELLAMGDAQDYAVQVDPDLYILPDEPGRYTNHSCQPNTGLKADRLLVALRPIAPGEEIRFDYSTCMSEQLWTMECHCGAPECRGLIGDFHDLPAEWQSRYLREGIVQRFIVREAEQLRRRRALPPASSLAARPAAASPA